MSNVISTEMKTLVKSSPFYLMLLVCAKDSGIEETIESLKGWEEEHMPKFREMIARGEQEVPVEVKLVNLIIEQPFNRPFEADDLHGMIDEFLARVDATPELRAAEEEHQHAARDYYTQAKERFANV